MLKILCGVILVILEVPFFFKIRQAQYDIIRQTAIIIIMGGIIPLIVYAIYWLGLFMIK